MENLLSIQREYFSSGATLPVSARIGALKKLRDVIESRAEDISAALYSDLGKSSFESYMSEIGMVLSEINYMLRHIKKYSRIKRVKTPLAQFLAKSYVKKSPYGCVLIMSPWNYPFMLAMEPLVDAIAAGNCAIVKPSAYSPATGKLIEDIVSDTFLPQYVKVVTGGRKENEALLDMPFDKIFFTGSYEVGKTVMRKAAERLTPVTLELGGKSPCVIDKSAKIKLAAKRIVFGKFLNCGQTCVAPDYVLVHKSVEQEFLSALREEIIAQFGEQPLVNPDYGKIVNQKHFERLCALIDRDKVYFGGQTDETQMKIAPTVLFDVSWDDECMKRELFGPVLPVIAFSDRDEALKQINSRAKSLAMYVFAEDKKVADTFISNCAFGGGCVNDVVIHIATSEMGFVGFGDSGMGSYHGKKGFDCFTHEKSIVDKSTKFDLPIRYQPYSKKKEKLLKLFMK